MVGIAGIPSPDSPPLGQLAGLPARCLCEKPAASAEIVRRLRP